MDSNELRRACERAGLRVYRENVSRPWMVEVDGWGGIHLAHPALPSYVADLLVGMVREIPKGHPKWNAFFMALSQQNNGDVWGTETATPMQRIRAAMVVLDGQ